ncbi:glycosyl hydrolase family 18 [Rhodanobacter sp. B04]|uniref:HlyD family secretion protein n=1 Tax=Rhodanobacter sp. B04 TaxID=1945860 RepID=UPI000986C0CC|nr:biotin/lipoyl-binding protein [Rhodanobacter sp. B04]OOG63471.1 glycosyl hydrolase family 18 [Rhodanobacter sp. B04]
MRNRIIFLVAALGALMAIASAYFYGREQPAQAPVFSPATNPYANGIYANGIVESSQGSGENINIYPDVSGRITQIMVHEGDHVAAGQPLLVIDNSVQLALAEQQKRQGDAALATLQELQAQPRRETLAVAAAQVVQAEASQKTASDTFEKQRHSYAIDPRSVSKDTLDNDRDALEVAKANLGLARRQYELTKAGAWSYDIRNQQMQYNALEQAYQASDALLQKYTIRASTDGIVLAMNTAPGSYVSAQGAYDAYTQGYDPIIVMGGPQDYLSVRCFIDEILLDRLPSPMHMKAQMSVRGTKLKIPLEFVRMQPYVTPKIELSDQRLERVDLRVLPIIFRFRKPADAAIYPGQLVDVYVAEK